MSDEKFKVVVVALIHDGKRKVLLGKRSMKEELVPGFWATPGGHVESSVQRTFDVLEKNLAREVREEMGVRVSVDSYLDSHSWIKGKHKKLYVVFLCKLKSGKPKPLMDTQEVKWFKLEEAIKLKNIVPIVKRFLRKADKVL